ncbi:hypothetical protein RJ640_003233 [Escallonia rubra]|uniref:Uncharacterized protein n=1 Tax=Escallonia rubra TaxID=112253 RepID=A0AA88UBF1_9ASTE|nr:hypothetical protein RJ640_003233 [Escallonia rubra]
MTWSIRIHHHVPDDRVEHPVPHRPGERHRPFRLLVLVPQQRVGVLQGEPDLVGVAPGEPHGHEDGVEVVEVEVLDRAAEGEALGLEGLVGDCVLGFDRWVGRYVDVSGVGCSEAEGRTERDGDLIAHHKEVYDIAWGSVDVLTFVSADGFVRVFDLRDKEHSTIIYESSEPDTPLVRLGWNKQDPRYMATIIMDSAKVVVLDIRFPTLSVVEIQRHQASVNAIAWAPHSSCHICIADDDSQALIWDLSSHGSTHRGWT